MISVSNWIAAARQRLQEAGIDSADADAVLLLRHALGFSREDVFLRQGETLDSAHVSNLESMLARRVLREPVSRICGARGFWKSDFIVTPQTLDPRPDSECLIAKALAVFSASPPRAVLDLGTGTGCLLLSLLQEWPAAFGVGVDISDEAAQTAAENARLLGLEARAQFYASDWALYRPDRAFDLVVSNPPYIPTAEIEGLEPEVLRHDPRRALDGGRDGLDCYRSLARVTPGLLAPEGTLLLEIGHDQADRVADILKKEGFQGTGVIQDLSGHDRCVFATWAGALH